jgi:hypothetical protein
MEIRNKIIIHDRESSPSIGRAPPQ